MEKVENQSMIERFREKMRKFTEDDRFDGFVLGVIILNAIVLGFAAVPELSEVYGNLFFSIDIICIVIFIIEMALKIFVQRTSFFKKGWNLFDFFVVSCGLIPSVGTLVVLRTFRVFRVLRLVSAFPALRRTVTLLFASIPKIAVTLCLLLLVFYVFGVMSVFMFGQEVVDFNSLGGAMLLLLQILTISGWQNEAAISVMTLYPDSWVFFSLFTLVVVAVAFNTLAIIIVDGVANISRNENKVPEIPKNIEEDPVAAEKIAALRHLTGFDRKSDDKNLLERLARIERKIEALDKKLDKLK